MKNNLGIIYALSAYTLWGVIPIFWKQISHIDSIEIVMHRMVWSCVLVSLLIILSREWSELKAVFSQVNTLSRLLVAAALISINWTVFIWAVNAGHLVETSLGYFMTPLISVALGVLIFGEVLRRGQLIALAFASLGLLYLLTAYGAFPWIAFTLAISFSLYSAVKKSLSVPVTHGMAIETLFFFFPALIYLMVLESSGSGQFFVGATNAWMLILGGLFTLIPLLLFAAAVKRVSLTALGMMQYIGPSLQLLIGIFLYQEAFGKEKLIAFGFIWLALGIYSADEILNRRLLNSSN